MSRILQANTGGRNRSSNGSRDMHLVSSSSDARNPYGFQYFDKSFDINEDEDEEDSDEDGFDMKSCPSNCCDDDCECDDCVRCSKTGLLGPEDFVSKASAA